MQILFPSFNLNLYPISKTVFPCISYPIYVGSLVIKQNTMPSPAQIMFMSSLINNVPESSPALLSIYSLIFIFKTKSFCLNKLILMVQFVESQCTSENCKLSQFKILKYFFESSFFSKVFLDVNTGSHYMILNRNNNLW